MQKSAIAVPNKLNEYICLFPNLSVKGTKIKAMSIVVVL